MAMVKKQRPTRYFTFTRTLPTQKDFDLLTENALKYNMHIGSRELRRSDGKLVLKGFIILNAHKTVQRELAAVFPNFLISTQQFILDAILDDEAELSLYDTGGRNHYFDSVKRKLF